MLKRVFIALVAAVMIVVIAPTASQAQTANAPFGTYLNTNDANCPPSSGFKWSPKPPGTWDNSGNFTNYTGTPYGCRFQAAGSTTPPPTNPGTNPPTNPPPSSGGLVWGQSTTPQSSSWTRPSIRSPYSDPAFGNSVQRVTDKSTGKWHRNDYSRRQAESADGRHLLTHFTATSGSNFTSTSGRAEWRVYDRVTGSRINSLPTNLVHPDGEPQWDPNDSNLIRHIGGPNASTGELKLFETNVRSLSRRTIADLTGRLQRVWPSARFMKDREEGAPSADGNRYAWIVYNGSGNPLGVVSYDLSSDTILGTVNAVSGVGSIGWSSASATGEYVLVSYGRATYVYNANMTNRRTVKNKPDHSDLALDINGDDVLVYVDFSLGANAGWVVSANLDTLAATRMFRLYGGSETSIHISGKGVNKPGWIVASTYNCKEENPDDAWACNKVFAAEIAPNGRILNLAHTYNCRERFYYNETQASVNRDFTRVYFNSDGGSERGAEEQDLCPSRVEMYEVSVPTFR